MILDGEADELETLEEVTMQFQLLVQDPTRQVVTMSEAGSGIQVKTGHGMTSDPAKVYTTEAKHQEEQLRAAQQEQMKKQKKKES